MDLNLITIARRASLGPRIVKSYDNVISQIRNIKDQYYKIKDGRIFSDSELLFNRKTSLIGITSLLEQYLFTVHLEILQSFPKKLGNDKFEIDEVLEEGGLLPVIIKMATKKVLDSAYSTFYKQINKISTLYEFTQAMPVEYIEQVNEVKCTRDVFVHSPESRINMLYLQKAGKQARGRNNDILKLDDSYFEKSIENILTLLEIIFNSIPQKYKNSNAAIVFKMMWESSCLRLPFEKVWEIKNNIPYPHDLESEYGFSSSEMEVYNLFRYIFGRRENHKPDFAYYFLRWQPSSPEAQIAYSWLDCQFYF